MARKPKRKTDGSFTFSYDPECCKLQCSITFDFGIELEDYYAGKTDELPPVSEYSDLLYDYIESEMQVALCQPGELIHRAILGKIPEVRAKLVGDKIQLLTKDGQSLQVGADELIAALAKAKEQQDK